MGTVLSLHRAGTQLSHSRPALFEPLSALEFLFVPTSFHWLFQDRFVPGIFWGSMDAVRARMQHL